jgi:hypothetical protein
MCIANYKHCDKCNNPHFFSYAVNNITKKKIFYNYSFSNKYFHYTNETIFEVTLLTNLMSDIMFKQSSFRGFASAYNYVHAKSNFERAKLDYRRLVEVFFCFHLTKYFDEILKLPLESNIK